MAALMSTGLPKSSALPLTQNTAPVLDFRCLYTHDLRQKKKRWHDGVLRFHTFNSRIMVYDLARNFIGDKYWRETEAIQDGDELELEKGVLVQVEEAVGRTEQDLAPILNHHKSAQSGKSVAIPVRAHVASTAVTTATSGSISRNNATLLRPKSLNAVLGTPRGKLGKAVLPAKSPFQSNREARSSFISVEDGPEQVQRPAKRLKISRDTVHGMESRVAGPGAYNTIDTPVVLETTSMQKKTRQPQRDAAGHEPPIVISSPVINLDTDAEDGEASEARHVSTKSSLIPKDPSPTTKRVQKNRETGSRADRLSSANARRIDRQKSKSNSREVSKSVSKVLLHNESTSLERTAVPAIQERSPPPYTIRFAATKPRRKLMYRNLLPNQPSPATKAAPAPTKTSTPITTSANMPSLHVNHDTPSILPHKQSNQDILAEPTPAPKPADSCTIPQPPPLRDGANLDSNPTSTTSRRFPIQRSRSENNASFTASVPARPPAFRKESSDSSHKTSTRSALSSMRDRALGTTAAAVATPMLVREDDSTGPWSREAFDLFGWRPGDSKTMSLGNALKTGA